MLKNEDNHGFEGHIQLKIQMLTDEYASLIDQKILLARRIIKIDDLITQIRIVKDEDSCDQILY